MNTFKPGEFVHYYGDGTYEEGRDAVVMRWHGGDPGRIAILDRIERREKLVSAFRVAKVTPNDAQRFSSKTLFSDRANLNGLDTSSPLKIGDSVVVRVAGDNSCYEWGVVTHVYLNARDVVGIAFAGVNTRVRLVRPDDLKTLSSAWMDEDPSQLLREERETSSV